MAPYPYPYHPQVRTCTRTRKSVSVPVPIPMVQYPRILVPSFLYPCILKYSFTLYNAGYIFFYTNIKNLHPNPWLCTLTHTHASVWLHTRTCCLYFVNEKTMHFLKSWNESNCWVVNAWSLKKFEKTAHFNRKLSIFWPTCSTRTLVPNSEPLLIFIPMVSYPYSLVYTHTHTHRSIPVPLSLIPDPYSCSYPCMVSYLYPLVCARTRTLVANCGPVLIFVPLYGLVPVPVPAEPYLYPYPQGRRLPIPVGLPFVSYPCIISTHFLVPILVLIYDWLNSTCTDYTIIRQCVSVH